MSLVAVMELTETEKQLALEAREYVKEQKKNIITQFLGDIQPAQEIAISVFMVGSPGAGKTEFSKELQGNTINVARIDADEIRNILPQYRGGNSYVFNAAASLGVDILYSYALKNKISTILDGTFQNYDKATMNIKRSLKRNRKITIFYVFQDPLVAWDFTQKREAVEGRHIPKEAFIKTLFAANENIKRIKNEYGDMVVINIVLKNIQNGNEAIYRNVQDVDQYVKIEYTASELERNI